MNVIIIMNESLVEGIIGADDWDCPSDETII